MESLKYELRITYSIIRNMLVVIGRYIGERYYTL